MPESTPLYLPNDLSEANFRRYEAFLTQAVQSFPGETQFTIPPGTAPTTFVARFRSATLSLRRFSWPTTVDTAKLVAIAGQYSIAFDSTTIPPTVWFRLKHRAGRPSHLINDARVLAPQVESSIALSKTVWQNVSPDELHALCLLLHGVRLYGPVVVDGLVNDAVILSLEGQFNVALVCDKVKNQTIIT